MDFRVGSGFDVHRFSDEPDRRLILCGVEVDGRGLVGHSDADVGCHAICDAVLGPIGLGGIGDVFPDTDSRYAGIKSTLLTQRVAEMVSEAGYWILNIDVTLICEVPRIAPYRSEMEKAMTALLKAPVTVKAKRAEGLGSIGRAEGIAAFATALLSKGEER